MECIRVKAGVRFKVKISVRFKNEHNDIYEGAYIDSKGNFNVNFIKGSKIKEIAELKNRKAIIHYVKYSLKYLENILKIFNSKMPELGISSMEINEQANKVYIYGKNMNKDKVNKIKQINNSSAIDFKNESLTIQ